MESRFFLAENSRLPGWFGEVSAPRQEVTVRLTYYTGLSDSVDLMRKDGTILGSFAAKMCWHPIMKQRPTYPHYAYVVANGVIEVLEHRRMEPVFYLSDDPSLIDAARKAETCAITP